jgi:DNA-binding transcriptional MerR regulator
MQISGLAEMLGITTRTIRLYEKLGLVEPPKRTGGQVRYYEKADVKHFKFVLKVKELGLSLEEMKELTQLYDQEPPGTREDHATPDRTSGHPCQKYKAESVNPSIA